MIRHLIIIIIIVSSRSGSVEISVNIMIGGLSIRSTPVILIR